MEYLECYICSLDPLVQWLVLVALAVIAFLAVRSRVWSFVVALSAVPLGLLYMEGISSALATAGALLIGVFVGIRMAPGRKGPSSTGAA
jgi:hypothetical protein